MVHIFKPRSLPDSAASAFARDLAQALAVEMSVFDDLIVKKPSEAKSADKSLNSYEIALRAGASGDVAVELERVRRFSIQEGFPIVRSRAILFS